MPARVATIWARAADAAAIGERHTGTIPEAAQWAASFVSAVTEPPLERFLMILCEVNGSRESQHHVVQYWNDGSCRSDFDRGVALRRATGN